MSSRELTDRQLLMWIEHELAPQSPSSNIVATFSIGAEIDGPRLERAFRSVVARSDALRTVFEITPDGSPRQRVLARIDHPLERVDVSGAADPEAAARAWVDERRRRPLPIDRRCFDSALLRLGPRRALWYLFLHHLVTDAWSCALVYRHTLEAYRSGGDAPALPAFSEYLGFCAELRGSPGGGASEAFWRERLAPPVEPVRFYGAPRRRHEFRRHRRQVTLEGPRLEALRRLAGWRPGVAAADQALATVLLTVLFAYLHRVSGNRRVGVGNTFLNRASREFRETIGPFMEVCPLRVDLDEDESFASLRERSARELREVLPHARACVGNPGQAPAFDVLLTFHSARFPGILGPTRTELTTGATGLPASAPGGAAADPESLLLAVHDFDEGGSPTVSFDFAADVFDPPSCERAVGHFLRLLDACLADPTRRVAEVDLLAEDERRQVLASLTGP